MDGWMDGWVDRYKRFYVHMKVFS